MKLIYRYLDGDKISENKLEKLYKRSSKAMRIGRLLIKEDQDPYKSPFGGDTNDYKEANNGAAQSTFLMPKKSQDEIMHRAGYTRNDGDYGLVQKAVGNRNIPVYQTAPDAISRDKLTVVGNVMQDDEAYFLPNARMIDPGVYPLALYVDSKTGEPYQKGWDLNDYAVGKDNHRKYNWISRLAANTVDKLGNPVVITTGYQKSDLTDWLIEAMRKKNLVPTEFIDMEYDPEVDKDLPRWVLPEVEIIANKPKLIPK